MASILRVNTLTDASSNNSVSLEIVSKGSAKTWFIYDQSNDTTDNSFSISSITDTSTGIFTSNFANNFSAKPCPVGMCSYFSFCNTRNLGGDAITTSDTDFNISNSGATLTDRNEISIAFQGDLA